MISDLTIIFVMSIITFAVFAFDKMKAASGGSRVPEVLLLVFSFLAGAFGALCAMVLCHHKTKRTVFLVCIPIFLFLQLAADILYRLSIYSMFN